MIVKRREGKQTNPDSAVVWEVQRARLWFPSWLHHVQVAWLWAKWRTSLRLSFLFCRSRIKKMYFTKSSVGWNERLSISNFWFLAKLPCPSFLNSEAAQANLTIPRTTHPPPTPGIQETCLEREWKNEKKGSSLIMKISPEIRSQCWTSSPTTCENTVAFLKVEVLTVWMHMKVPVGKAMLSHLDLETNPICLLTWLPSPHHLSLNCS